MKNYSIFILLLLGQMLFAETTSINVYEPLTVEMSVNKFDLPIHISYHSITSLNGNNEPDWLETYLKSRDLVNQDYEAWISLYHRDYSAGIMDLSKDKFLTLRKRFGESFGNEKSSIIYAVTFHSGEISYVYALSRKDQYYSTYDEAIASGRVSSHTFIDEGDGWKMFDISSGPSWFRSIAMMSTELFQQVEEKGNIVLGPKGSIPSYFSELKPFDFFVTPRK